MAEVKIDGAVTRDEKKLDRSSLAPVTGVKRVVHGAEVFEQRVNCHCVPAGVMVLLSGRVTERVPVPSIAPV
jgi:hypothetical protein